MQSVTENESINKKLAQIQAAFRNDRMITMMNQNEGEWFFKIIDNINCQVIATNYLQMEHPEWIGNTPLHFAADENLLDTFDILLNHGADFTIKNNNNLTALHQVMEKHMTETSGQYTLDNPFVHSVLSAHLKYSNFKNPSSENGLSHFHIACAVNNVEAAKGFLESGVFIDHAVKMDSPTFPGFTLLHFTAKYFAFEVTDFLLSHGANVHVKDAKGKTPLHVALERKLEIISDTDANEALKDSNERILQSLLNKESDNNIVIVDERGLSNFHISCALKDSKVAEYILQKVVNINGTVDMDSPLWPGYTPLHFAAVCNLDTVKLIMKNGADINAKDAKGVTPFDMCIERYKTEDIHTIICSHETWKNIVLSDGKTKLLDLIFAMRNSNQLRIFLSKLWSTSVCRDSALWPGCSPMHLAVMLAKKDAKPNEASEQMKLQILRNLYKRSHKMLHRQDIHGHTPLHVAFRLNKKPVLDLLLEFLRELPESQLEDRVDEDGLSFVHIAAAQNDIRTLQRLLSMGANVNVVYRGKSQFSPMVYQGSTSLHFAVINRCTEAVKLLMNFGADLYIKDSNDMTPIHLLLLSKTSGRIAHSLLSTPNLKDSTVNGIGLNHLHVACWYWVSISSDTVKRLLDNGADINAKISCKQDATVDSNILALLKQYEGHSPSIIAFDQDAYKIAMLLFERGADIFVEYKRGVPLVYRIILNEYEFLSHDFLKALRKNEALMSRLKAEAGITLLHVACFELNIGLIEQLLDEGTDVNAQILSDSPIQQGYTPMHIVMHCADDDGEDIIEIVELLLKAGADVTLQSAKMETAVHVAHKTFCNNPDTDSYLRVNMLLEAQQDFSVNPTNADGISHFHIACEVCNVSIAEKFLDCGEININRRIDYFSDVGAGCSALQLAAGSIENYCTVLKQLETVDLLLTHGADIHTVDFYGETPIHDCARTNSVDLFERLARSEADVNARNIIGDTPLCYYLKSKKVSVEGIKTLIRFGCRLNTYCTLTHKGYLGETIHEFSYADVRNLISALMMNFKPEMRMDNLSRTVIHNIVSIESPKISTKEYAELIEQLSRVGCDVDDQDNFGRTALHMAVKFCNFKGISGLLLAGADINITDNNGNTAWACNFDTCVQCDNYPNEEKCKHLEILEILAVHVKKLQLCGLDVNKQNEEFTSKAFTKLRILLTDEFFKELETVKRTKIESHALTLYDFLSEYGAIVDYPRMSEVKRNDINKFFSLGRVENYRVHFPQLAGILQLQYRKVSLRSKLVELAKNTLTDFAGFRLPEICSDFILILLKNSELKNLIASISSAENKK